MLGRRIQPVFAPYIPVGSASIEEGCNRLALDEEVFATVGPVLADGPLCYTELYDTAFVGSAHNHERRRRSIAPWFATVTDLDDAAEIIVRGFATEGIYEGHRVAVVGNTDDQIPSAATTEAPPGAAQHADRRLPAGLRGPTPAHH